MQDNCDCDVKQVTEKSNGRDSIEIFEFLRTQLKFLNLIMDPKHNEA